MDFDSEERYACAALFTLALHLCQADHGFTEADNNCAWGQTVADAEEDDIDSSGMQTAEVAAAEWSAFWGWDCCGPGGILEQMYAALQVQPKSWPGLKRLPEVGGVSAQQRQPYLRLVSSYIQVLDKDLPSLHAAVAARNADFDCTLVNTESGEQAVPGLDSQEMRLSGLAQLRQTPDLLEDLVTDSDSDLEGDLASARLQRRIVRQHSNVREPQKSGSRSSCQTDPDVSFQELRETVNEAQSSDFTSATDALAPDKSAGKAEAALLALQRWNQQSNVAVADRAADVAEDKQQEGAVGASLDHQISKKALAALWELLEACVCQNLSSTSQENEEEVEEPGRKVVGGMRPVSRWYDARQRCSLKLLAHWLRVPWKMVVNFECLLVYRLLLPPEEASKAALTPWDQGMRAAKIGAATLGIGAIFAVTGGLAAPAIAAGVGAAIGLAGGSAAVATGVTGFLATSAGGAVVASAVGAAGSGLAVPHLAHRIGVVKEFGFWALDWEGKLGSLEKQSLPRHKTGEISADITEEAKLTTSGNDSNKSCNGQPQDPASKHTGQLEDTGNSLGLSNQSTGTGLQNDLQNAQHLESPANKKETCGEQPVKKAGWFRFRASRPVLASNGSQQQASRDTDFKDACESANTNAEARAPDDGHICLTQGKPKQDFGSRHSIDNGQGNASPNLGKPQSQQPDSHWWHRRKAEDKKPLLLLPGPLSPARKVADMRMSTTIGVCGWIKDSQDFVTQWEDLTTCQQSSEAFTLVWESKELKELNSAIVAFAASQAGQEAAKWVLQHFFFTGLVAALAWPAIIYSAVQLIDTAWSVALQRAQKAGRLLAHILAAGAHGNRPVILVGNSMGARLIFHCLLELARLKAKGIVEHACLLGTPVAVRPERWAMARSVVAGRLINGYSRKDWLLAVVYRGANGFIKDAAGLGPVASPGIENVNLTGLVQGHFEYISKVGEILELISLYD